MTLIVGLGCSDGIVLASDSAGTESAGGIKIQLAKLNYQPNPRMLSGFSGDIGLNQRISPEFDKMTRKKTVAEFQEQLANRITPYQKAAAANFVHIPGTMDACPTATYLIGTIINKIPYLIEVDQNGNVTHYGTEFGDFQAIGSGKPFAYAFIGPLRDAPRSIEDAKIIAYRILDDSIKLAANYLSEPIHICTMDLDGKASEIDEIEKRALSDTCDFWRENQVEAFRDSIVPRPAAPSAPPPTA